MFPLPVQSVVVICVSYRLSTKRHPPQPPALTSLAAPTPLSAFLKNTLANPATPPTDPNKFPHAYSTPPPPRETYSTLPTYRYPGNGLTPILPSASFIASRSPINSQFQTLPFNRSYQFQNLPSNRSYQFRILQPSLTRIHHLQAHTLQTPTAPTSCPGKIKPGVSPPKSAINLVSLAAPIRKDAGRVMSRWTGGDLRLVEFDKKRGGR